MEISFKNEKEIETVVKILMIARLLYVSNTAMSNSLKNSEDHGTKNKEKKTWNTDDSWWKRYYSNVKNEGFYNFKGKQPGLTFVSRQTVYKYIKKIQNLPFQEETSAKWTKMHLAKSLTWVRNHMSCITE